MQTYEAASKGAQGALGFAGAPLRLAEREARNPALRAGKSLGFGGAPLRLAERKARNPALRAGKVSFCVCRSCFLLPFVSLSCASEEAAEGVAFPQEDEELSAVTLLSASGRRSGCSFRPLVCTSFSYGATGPAHSRNTKRPSPCSV
jgi:hypothetical protein